MSHTQSLVPRWLVVSRGLAWFGAACVAVAVSACGGGGGGEGAQATLSADVYPLAVGDRHLWRVSSGPNAGTERSESVSHTSQIDGRTAYAIRDESGRISYVTLTPTGVASAPGPDATAFEAAFGSIEVIGFGQTVGEVLVPFDRTVTVDIDGDGRADSVQLRYEVTFLGYENITTTLGTFTGAAHLRIGTRSTYLYAGRPERLDYAGTNESWHAPGIGLVRSTSKFTVNGGVEQSSVEELVAYRVGALRSETVAPSLLSSNPAAGGFAPASIAIELNYSEVLDALSLEAPQGPRLLNGAGQVVPTTLSLAQGGKRLLVTPRAPLIEGRYELQIGSTLTDFVGNSVAGPTTFVFTVDTSAPQFVSSTPTNGAQNVPLTGDLVLRFSEPVFAGLAGNVMLSLFGGTTPSCSNNCRQELPAVIRGNEVVASLAFPLQPNAEYTLSLGAGNVVVDAVRNVALTGGLIIRFRAAPAP